MQINEYSKMDRSIICRFFLENLCIATDNINSPEKDPTKIALEIFDHLYAPLQIKSLKVKISLMDQFNLGSYVVFLGVNQFYIYPKTKKTGVISGESSSSSQVVDMGEKIDIKILEHTNRLLGQGVYGAVFAAEKKFSPDTPPKRKTKAVKIANISSLNDDFPQKAAKTYSDLSKDGKPRGILPISQLIDNYIIITKQCDGDLKVLLRNPIEENNGKELPLRFLSTNHVMKCMEDMLSGLWTFHKNDYCHLDIKKNNVLYETIPGADGLLNFNFFIADLDWATNEEEADPSNFLRLSPIACFKEDVVELVSIYKKGQEKLGVISEDSDPEKEPLYSDEFISSFEEQIRELLAFRKKMDVAALGLMFFELLTGNPNTEEDFEDSSSEGIFFSTDDKNIILEDKSMHARPIADPKKTVFRVDDEEIVGTFFISQEFDRENPCIQEAKRVHGERLMNLVIKMVEPFERRISVEEALEEFKMICLCITSSISEVTL